MCSVPPLRICVSMMAPALIEASVSSSERGGFPLPPSPPPSDHSPGSVESVELTDHMAEHEVVSRTSTFTPIKQSPPSHDVCSAILRYHHDHMKKDREECNGGILTPRWKGEEREDYSPSISRPNCVFPPSDKLFDHKTSCNNRLVSRTINKDLADLKVPLVSSSSLPSTCATSCQVMPPSRPTPSLQSTSSSKPSKSVHQQHLSARLLLDERTLRSQHTRTTTRLSGLSTRLALMRAQLVYCDASRHLKTTLGQMVETSHPSHGISGPEFASCSSSERADLQAEMLRDECTRKLSTSELVQLLASMPSARSSTAVARIGCQELQPVDVRSVGVGSRSEMSRRSHTQLGRIHLVRGVEGRDEETDSSSSEEEDEDGGSYSHHIAQLPSNLYGSRREFRHEPGSSNVAALSRYMTRRGELSWRWIWGVAQVQDVEYRLRQLHHRHQKYRSRRLHIAASSKTSTTSKSSPPTSKLSKLDGSDNLEDSCSRTRPVNRRWPRHPVLRVGASFKSSSSSSTHAGSTVPCRCDPPSSSLSSSSMSCVMCGGRVTTYRQIVGDNELMSLSFTERQELVDPSHHRVLSRHRNGMHPSCIYPHILRDLSLNEVGGSSHHHHHIAPGASSRPHSRHSSPTLPHPPPPTPPTTGAEASRSSRSLARMVHEASSSQSSVDEVDGSGSRLGALSLDIGGGAGGGGEVGSSRDSLLLTTDSSSVRPKKLPSLGRRSHPSSRSSSPSRVPYVTCNGGSDDDEDGGEVMRRGVGDSLRQAMLHRMMSSSSSSALPRGRCSTKRRRGAGGYRSISAQHSPVPSTSGSSIESDDYDDNDDLDYDDTCTLTKKISAHIRKRGYQKRKCTATDNGYTRDKRRRRMHHPPDLPHSAPHSPTCTSPSSSCPSPSPANSAAVAVMTQRSLSASLSHSSLEELMLLPLSGVGKVRPIEYKEIQTPRWSMFEGNASTPTVDAVMMEDDDDDVYLLRHSKLEVHERQRLLSSNMSSLSSHTNPHTTLHTPPHSNPNSTLHTSPHTTLHTTLHTTSHHTPHTALHTIPPTSPHTALHTSPHTPLLPSPPLTPLTWPWVTPLPSSSSHYYDDDERHHQQAAMPFVPRTFPKASRRHNSQTNRPFAFF